MQASDMRAAEQRHVDPWMTLGLGQHTQQCLQQLDIEAYRTLGVHPTANIEVIHKAYRDFLKLAAEAGDGGVPDAATTLAPQVLTKDAGPRTLLGRCVLTFISRKHTHTRS